MNKIKALILGAGGVLPHPCHGDWNIPEECLFADDRVCNLEGAIHSSIHAVQMCRDVLEEWNNDAAHDLCELNDYLEELL